MSNLAVSGVLAGDGNGRPNVIELYALATNTDLYAILFVQDRLSIGCCSSGISEGDFYYITDDEANFTSFFGFDANFTSQEIIEGFHAGTTFGELAFEITDGGGTGDLYGNSSTTSWFYNGGWAYRKDGTAPAAGSGRSNRNTVFVGSLPPSI